MKDKLPTTMCIIHKGFSGMRSIVSRSKFSNGGYERSPQSLTKSYTHRWLSLRGDTIKKEYNVKNNFYDTRRAN